MRRARSIAHVKERLRQGRYAYGLHGESDVCLLIARAEGEGPEPTPGQLERIKACLARGYYENASDDIRFLLSRPATALAPARAEEHPFDNYAEPVGLG